MNGIEFKSPIIPLLVRRAGWIVKQQPAVHSLCPAPAPVSPARPHRRKAA
ncbi:hypothetical protein OVA24_08995 [Luteolibacter sp. SL250]|nr:hypothetical protein [Luteolibacter sp. SL250]WAC21518.1 hypothetical protein OVA24_08995 [Luteolibacter sp. SL250]